MLAEDVGRFEAAVNRLVKVPLSQGQFDALVSFSFNVGEGALADSTLLRKLNARDYKGARREFARWNKGGGRVLPGLTRRRAAEAKLFGGGKPVKAKKRIKTVQGRLRKIGFRVKVDGVKGQKTRQAIREFQRGYARAKLPVDGNVRIISRTYRAIRWSASHGGRCSKNFKYREFASKGNGVIKLNRRLVLALEAYRARVGHGVQIVSAYRDPDHNRRVGGAKCSRHSDVCGNPGGDAADFKPEMTFESVKRLGVFTGIGIIRANGLVRHGDVRPGNVNSPTTWYYG
jgi:peptidoglycan hydrolase-like protein with peptidoglycan-binding domain